MRVIGCLLQDLLLSFSDVLITLRCICGHSSHDNMGNAVGETIVDDPIGRVSMKQPFWRMIVQ